MDILPIKEEILLETCQGNLDLDLDNVWPYKFTLSEIQCAGYLLIKELIN